ncbi:MAG: 16S rRNA (adenine(1518)-N(6)/adenine(1519)-N(6))-dimethyltransferase RsmA [Bacteroidales bacterium]|nr:16S rRNA (adenine(1518)-N(6)/adenine(1519)-N(6))-dimethyltransferase RsmA [Bacteroidales bacterium]
MERVRPKKRLGQHFLKDRNIAEKISNSLTGDGYHSVLEVGPGTGILTGLLLKRNFRDFRVIEIDEESVAYLKERFPEFKNIISGDFLELDIDALFSEPIAIIGNFPYNISSQIFFRILKYRNIIREVCCMVQKEVAERICAGPGSRTYGILSVLIQAFYSAEYLFSVSPSVFAPPPKVLSGVMRMKRNSQSGPGCNEELFFKVVKTCFNQRRKILRNSLKKAFRITNEDYPLLSLRPEQLSVAEFTDLTNWIEENFIKSE